MSQIKTRSTKSHTKNRGKNNSNAVLEIVKKTKNKCSHIEGTKMEVKIKSNRVKGDGER